MQSHHKTKIIFGAFLGIIGLYTLLSSGIPGVERGIPERPELTETQPISKTQSTGGSRLPEPDSSSTAKQADSDPNDQLASPESKVASDPEIAQIDNAPKQTDIKNTVTEELTYHAFLLPNDPYASESIVFPGTNAEEAWDITTGGNAVVAVIDTGYALNHEDLEAAWHTNGGEQGMTASGGACWTGTPQDKTSNDCDDDSNGYVDDWRGWNFIEVDNNPQAGRQDPNGLAVSHGTQTAGLVGAVSNNGIGTASLNWQTKIMPLQALEDAGPGYTSDIIAAVYYAVDNGADIINMSLGGYQADPYMSTAIQYAYDHGVVVIAAAGNCGTGTEYGCDPSNPGAIAHPARDPYVIAVGAVDDSNQRAEFSSYGPALDVVAPGSGSIVSPMWLPTNQTSAYSSNLYGTSFAAPIVSSLASLLRSERPSSSVDDITAIIDASASKIAGLGGRNYNDMYGHGLIDSLAATSVARHLQQSSATPKLEQTGSSISRHSYSATSLLSSGCEVSSTAFCTVWARDTNGRDRYLPYKLSSKKTAWQWYSSMLDSGEWRLRTRSGDNVSSESYFMFAK